MNNRFQRVIRRFGAAVQLIQGSEQVEVRAFVQPVTSFDKRYYKDAVTEAGLVSEMRFLYLGPAEHSLSRENTVVFEGREFEPVSTELIYAGSVPLCCWAVLREID